MNNPIHPNMTVNAKMTRPPKVPISVQIPAELKDKNLCKVRTVTTFVNLKPDMTAWHSVLVGAIEHGKKTVATLNRQGHTVQSMRIVTNPYGEYLDTSSVSTAATGLAKIKKILTDIDQSDNALRVRFAIGEAKTAHEISLLPKLIAQYGDLCNACVNVTANDMGILDNTLIEHCVSAVQNIAQRTPRGEGNFNFTVNFNCDEFIPYFPASYHSGKIDKGLVMGLETPDLLVKTLQYVYETSAYHSVTYVIVRCWQCLKACPHRTSMSLPCLYHPIIDTLRRQLSQRLVY